MKYNKLTLISLVLSIYFLAFTLASASTEGVDINVDGKLSLIGSAIVNAELDDNNTIVKDLGNLNISAGSFEYEDLTDYSENSQTGFSVAGGGSSTTLGATNTGSETEGKTYATIGNGTVTIKDGSAIDYLNRDVTLMQETTKDLVTGALDGSMTIDNRWFSDNGTDAILKDFNKLGENLGQIGKGLTGNVVSQSIKNALTDNQTNIFEAVQDYINLDGKVSDIQEDKELTAELNGLTNSEDAEALEDSLQELADKANEDGSRSVDVSLTDQLGEFGDDKGYAYGAKDGNSLGVGIDIQETDITNSGEVINVMFHETSDIEEHSANHQTADNRGDTAEAIWALKNYGNENTNNMSGADWYNNSGKGSYAVVSGNSTFQNNLNNYMNNPDDYHMEGQGGPYAPMINGWYNMLYSIGSAGMGQGEGDQVVNYTLSQQPTKMASLERSSNWLDSPFTRAIFPLAQTTLAAYLLKDPQGWVALMIAENVSSALVDTSIDAMINMNYGEYNTLAWNNYFLRNNLDSSRLMSHTTGFATPELPKQYDMIPIDESTISWKLIIGTTSSGTARLLPVWPKTGSGRALTEGIYGELINGGLNSAKDAIMEK